MQSYDPNESRVGRSDHIIITLTIMKDLVHLGWDQCRAEKALIIVMHINDVN